MIIAFSELAVMLPVDILSMDTNNSELVASL